MQFVNIETFLGRTISDIIIDDDDKQEIVFKMNDGTSFRMYHDQDCCECVWIDQIDGDLSDLIGLPLLLAEEASNEIPPYDEEEGDEDEDEDEDGDGDGDGDGDEEPTWTFYKLATAKGYVTIRWGGVNTSDGWSYSLAVSIEKLSN